jgi:death-on-curing protein
MEFLRFDDVCTTHARLLEEYGGAPGLRDEGALVSAITAAENRAHDEHADLVACAAAYAFHLTNAHAFIDGERRVAAAACEVFLELNGAFLTASDDALYGEFRAMADGSRGRDAFEAWLRGVVA